ncbi:MAG: DUF427 domain-containing protein [Balneola sp.]|nr:MAG: DUF427 domain-containing protein [Balneola sp.]
MAKIPNWIKANRDKWEYRGQKRPPFALEPESGQESVWDYPRPPKIVADSRTVVVKSEGIIISETSRAIRILETASPPTFYLPPDSLNMDFLQPSGGASLCEWKGAAQYWDVIAGTGILRKVAWSYPNPFEDFSAIAGYLSFYPAHLDCYVDGEKVRPQPGGFYGGWITSEIVGPFKGEIPEASL